MCWAVVFSLIIRGDQDGLFDLCTSDGAQLCSCHIRADHCSWTRGTSKGYVIRVLHISVTRISTGFFPLMLYDYQGSVGIWLESLIVVGEKDTECCWIIFPIFLSSGEDHTQWCLGCIPGLCSLLVLFGGFYVAIFQTQALQVLHDWAMFLTLLWWVLH